MVLHSKSAGQNVGVFDMIPVAGVLAPGAGQTAVGRIRVMGVISLLVMALLFALARLHELAARRKSAWLPKRDRS